jgi:toxin ParE1/3/4
MVEIRWLKEARDDLKEIYDYISRDSKPYAERQVSRVFERTQIIKNHLKAGRVVKEINRPDIREIIEGNYRIIYRIVNEKTVHILMVHHGARDLKRRLSK